MKKLFLSLALCFISISIKAFEFYNGTLTFQTWSDTECALVSASITNLDIPSTATYGGKVYTVIGISNYKKFNCETATLPNTIQFIGNIGFSKCTTLYDINIPNKRIGIDAYVFEGVPVEVKNNYIYAHCPNSATSVDITQGISEITHSAFRDCKLIESIEIPNSVNYIGKYAFGYCSGLKSIKIPSSVTSIGSDAFIGCESLSDIYFDGSEELWNNISGLSYTNIPKETTIHYTIAEGSYGDNIAWDLTDEYTLTIKGNGSIEANAPWEEFQSQIKKVVFEGSITICDMAFKEYTSLSTIEGTSGCISIGAKAFQDCSSLTSVDLAACTYIGEAAFVQCSSLTSIGDLSACTSIGNSAFYGCSLLTSIGDLSACKNIGEWAFGYCYSLTSVDLSSCEIIGTNAFSLCESLKEVGSLNSCNTIGDNAFIKCYSLTNIGDIPNCTSIGYCAFDHCHSLESVGNCSSLQTIVTSAFSDCRNLSSIGELPKIEKIGDAAFSGTIITKIVISSSHIPQISDAFVFGNYATVFVPESLLDEYKNGKIFSESNYTFLPIGTKTDWVVNTSASDMSSGLQSTIGEENLSSVLNLKINGSINSYDIFVIRNKMHNLHSLDLSDATIKSNPYAYYANYSTTDNEIGNYAFYELTKLINVKLPKNLKKIGVGAFLRSDLHNIEMYAGITEIGDNAFSWNGNLQNVIIPEGVKIIGGEAFEFCSNLSHVILPSTLETIEHTAFFCCSSLSTIDFPQRLSFIGDQAFEGCNFKEVTLPSSIKELGNQCFHITNLSDVKVSAIDANSVIMNDNAFNGYTNKTLYVPYDEETGWDATYWAYYWHTQWGQFGTIKKWLPNYSNVNIGGDYIQDKGKIPGDEIDVTVGFEGGYILGKEGDAFQAFDDLVLRNNGSKGSSIIADNNLRVNKLSQEIDVEGNRWYFFCFPFDVKVADIQAPGQSVWRKYNAAVRAATGNSGWQSLGSEEKTLKAGTGYIFQCNQNGTLILPIENPDFTADNKDITLETHTAENKQDASWNFVGNPYPSYYELEDVAHDAPVTYWNGSSYVAVRPGDDDYAIQPYQAFFVQKTEESDEVGFDKTKRETYKQSQKKAKQAKANRAKMVVNQERLLLNIIISDGENTDKTRVVFNDKQLMNYEPECDASKFMSTEPVPQIYTTHANVNYAINERPNLSGEVQLCFKAPKAGTYTIAMARMDTPMLLKDAEANLIFDFANGAYTFEAKAGVNTSRFLLVKNSDVTAIHPTTVGESESASFFNLAGQQTSASTKGVKIVKTNSTTKKVLTK